MLETCERETQQHQFSQSQLRDSMEKPQPRSRASSRVVYDEIWISLIMNRDYSYIVQVVESSRIAPISACRLLMNSDHTLQAHDLQRFAAMNLTNFYILVTMNQQFDVIVQLVQQ
jgi:hypothetical protein